MGCLNYHRIKLRGQWLSECKQGRGVSWGAPIRPCDEFAGRFSADEIERQAHRWVKMDCYRGRMDQKEGWLL